MLPLPAPVRQGSRLDLRLGRRTGNKLNLDIDTTEYLRRPRQWRKLRQGQFLNALKWTLAQ
jgi:hypothetical protein